MPCWPSQGVDVGMGKLEAAIYAQAWGICTGQSAADVVLPTPRLAAQLLEVLRVVGFEKQRMLAEHSDVWTEWVIHSVHIH